MQRSPAFRSLDEEDVVSSQGAGESSHREVRKDMRPLVKASRLLRNDLQSGFERMVIGIGDIERKDRRPGLDERLTCGVIIAFHRHTAPTESAEPVTDQHDRLRSRQRLERLTNELKRTLDAIRPSSAVRAEMLYERERKRLEHGRRPFEQQVMCE